MGHNKNQLKIRPTAKAATAQQLPTTNSLLDIMEEGREFESTLKYRPQVNIGTEWKRIINEIETLRRKPCICYLSNTINSKITVSTSIDQTDQLPFTEMINSIPNDIKDIDIILITNGGSGQQVAKFVNSLRPRFDNVSFILPNVAMSAGSIFIMSGNEIIMGPDSYFGPIDPQIPNTEGRFVPAQSIIALINDIQINGEKLIKNGKNPRWVDLEILRSIDKKDIGAALTASQYSISLVTEYLEKYKFSSWVKHSLTGLVVTQDEKHERAEEIAEKLCNHELWKSHSTGISREVAYEKCKLQITRAEDIPNFYRSLRRFWALTYWIFENTKIAKAFLSDNYTVLKTDPSI